MFSALKNFFAKADGAVTVDWVVICAAITVLCLTAIDHAKGGVDNLAAALEQGISTTAVEAE